MKKFLFLIMLLSTQAKAGFLYNIPVVSWERVKADAPVSEAMQFCEPPGFGIPIPELANKPWLHCTVLALRPSAIYGQRIVIVMPENMAKQVLRSSLNGYYTRIPDPISIVAVPDEDFPYVRMGNPKRSYDSPDTTDPDIGWKMIYCQGGAAVCAVSTAAMAEMGGIKNALMMFKTCAVGTVTACNSFIQSWKLEQRYIQKQEDEAIAKGNRPTPFQKWYRRLWEPNPSGTSSSPGGSADGGPAPGSGSGGVQEGGVLVEQCYENTVGMGGGPLGEHIEVTATDCFYN